MNFDNSPKKTRRVQTINQKQDPPPKFCGSAAAWLSFFFFFDSEFFLPLALAGMENEVLVILGTDGELVFRWVENIQQ